MAIEKEIVDRLLANYEKPEDLTGENGVLRQLTKALMERALEAEMAAPDAVHADPHFPRAVYVFQQKSCFPRALCILDHELSPASGPGQMEIILWVRRSNPDVAAVIVDVPRGPT